MTTIPAIDTNIWASVVRPGMVIDLNDGTRIAVERIQENYDTFTFSNLSGEAVTVDYAELVTVKGYFNAK